MISELPIDTNTEIIVHTNVSLEKLNIVIADINFEFDEIYKAWIYGEINFNEIYVYENVMLQNSQNI